MHLKTLPLLSLFPTLIASASVTTDYLVTNKCSRKTVKGDKIDVHYRGTLASDGTEFDASYNRGMPLTFTVGNGMVIKGWDEGLLDMCIGDKRKLTIPPEFGYGNRATGPIPAGSTLIFETELVSIAGVTKEEPEADASGTEEIPPVAEEAPANATASVTSSVKEAAAAASSAASDAAEAVTSTVKDATEGTGEGIQDAAEAVGSGAKEAAKTVASGVKDEL